MRRAMPLVVTVSLSCAGTGSVVHDASSGLDWEVGSAGPMTWAEAEARCSGLGPGWRVPSRAELKALADERRAAPVIDPVFSETPSAWFWASDPYPNAPSFRWGVSFEYGGFHYLHQSRRHAVRCVRGSDAGAWFAANATIERARRREGYVVLQIKPDGEPIGPIEPGQTVLFGLTADVPRDPRSAPEDFPVEEGAILRRRYTVTSTLGSPLVEVAARFRPTGALSPRLQNLKAGDRVWLSREVRGPSIAKVAGDRDLVLISIGIGVAHHVGFIRGLPCDGARKVALIHGGRTPDDLWFREELEAKAARCPSFVYLPTPSIETLWRERPLARAWGAHPAPASTHVSLCTSPELIETMLKILGEEGFREGTAESGGHVDWCEAD